MSNGVQYIVVAACCKILGMTIMPYLFLAFGFFFLTVED